MRRTPRAALLGIALLAASPAAGAEVIALDAPDMPIGGAAFLMGDVFDLHAKLAPALFGADDAILAVTDRGPVAPCADPGPLTGADAGALCGGSDDGMVFANVEYAPMIHALALEDDALALTYAIPLKGPKEEPVTGRPPLFFDAPPQPAYTAFGEAAPFDAGGVDPAGIVRMPDYSYLIAESYGPSLLEVRVDGAILHRHAPKGRDEALAEAPYPVSGNLPAALAGSSAVGLALHDGTAWLATRGPKGTALTPVETDGMKAGKAIAYRPGKGARLTGLAATGAGRLIAMERKGRSWAFYRLTLDGKTADKTPLVASKAVKKAPGRVAGFAIVDDRTLLLAEDDDYGLGAAEPGRFVLLRLDKGVLR